MKKLNRFFSGFCFEGEEELFYPFASLAHPYSLSGFSYGAILAFQEALKHIANQQRLQTLNLFSPAFFQNKSPAFLKMQILGFKKSPTLYTQNFLALCGNPNYKFFKQGKLEELEELLYFQWKKEDLQKLLDYGVQINVFLGEEDKIISPSEVSDFFSPFALIYRYKQLNHCLSHDHL